MSKASKSSTLGLGVLSPLLAGVSGIVTYRTLTRASSDVDSDYVFRLSMTAVAMAVPFLLTLVAAKLELSAGPLSKGAKAGLLLATLSLGLTWLPIKGLMARVRQAENLALEGIAAPMFDTVDINGQAHRLADHEGKVVLINIWATWCGPCRREMPDLERLYQSRKDEGLMIFGISEEDVETQHRFADTIAVSYPLLTINGDVPGTYSEIARYPANFLIDRQGRLREAPSTDQPFANLEAAVDALLVGAAERD